MYTLHVHDIRKRSYDFALTIFYYIVGSFEHGKLPLSHYSVLATLVGSFLLFGHILLPIADNCSSWHLTEYYSTDSKIVDKFHLFLCKISGSPRIPLLKVKLNIIFISSAKSILDRTTSSMRHLYRVPKIYVFNNKIFIGILSFLLAVCYIGIRSHNGILKLFAEMITLIHC